MLTTVIGLMGPAGAGKSSVANYLVEKYGAKKYALAAPLKQLAVDTMGFSHQQVWGTQEQKEAVDERYGFSPRWFLQRLGTEGIRKNFGDDFWVRYTLGEGGVIWRERPMLAVVEDVRFVNEAEAILNGWQYGHVWRLESPGQEAATTADQNHASESGWKDAPYSFIVKPAVRGLEHLYRCVDDAARHAQLFPKRPELPL